MTIRQRRQYEWNCNPLWDTWTAETKNDQRCMEHVISKRLHLKNTSQTSFKKDMASWRCSCNCWWTLFFWQSQIRIRQDYKERSVSVNTCNTLWIEIVFVKTHRQEVQDLKGSAQLLTIHFERMKMLVVCTFKKSFYSSGLFSLFFRFAGGVTQSSHHPHHISYNAQKFTYVGGSQV